jgi:hypothetical protein
VRKDDTSKTLIPLRIQKEKRNHGMTNERNEDIRMRIRCLTGREPARKRKKKKNNGLPNKTRREKRKKTQMQATLYKKTGYRAGDRL